MFLARACMAAAGGNGYQNVVLQDKPVAFWPLNETSGVVAHDISGNGNNATYQASPSLGATPVAGGLGASVRLDGNTQFVELTSPPASLQIVNGSFEAWVKLNATPNGGGLFSSAYTGAGSVNFALAFGATIGAASGDLPFFGKYSGTAWAGVADASALTNGSPYHIVGTFDGSTYSLYINGTLIGTASGTGQAPNSNPIYMGRRWDTAGTDSYLAANISNFAIYNTVLTPARILAHYNAGIA